MLSRRLNREQKLNVRTVHLVLAGAVASLIGWSVGGPIGTLVGPLFGFALATYNARLQADHDRRQSMIEELDNMMDQLIERLTA
jgi:membrane protein required for beta-lactamase induction